MKWICKDCDFVGVPVNHNNRGSRCPSCWSKEIELTHKEIPNAEIVIIETEADEWDHTFYDEGVKTESTPITPEWIERNTPDLTKLGINTEQMLALHDLDIVGFDDVLAASDATLKQVKGIGPGKAHQMKERAREMVE